MQLAAFLAICRIGYSWWQIDTMRHTTFACHGNRLVMQLAAAINRSKGEKRQRVQSNGDTIHRGALMPYFTLDSALPWKSSCMTRLSMLNSSDMTHTNGIHALNECMWLMMRLGAFSYKSKQITADRQKKNQQQHNSRSQKLFMIFFSSILWVRICLCVVYGAYKQSPAVGYGILIDSSKKGQLFWISSVSSTNW